jgi:hypothetical protein
MSSDMPKNMAASVHQRLLNHARLSGDDPQYMLMRFGLERLMYRLSQSRHAHLFTVKGALMFLVWAGEPYRPTKDLDLMTRRSHSADQLKAIFRDVCHIDVESDGLRMIEDSVNVEAIRENAKYGGMRVSLRAMLGPARIPLQADIGFGDAITPKAKEESFPTLLGFPCPRLLVYPKETTIAEKHEALVCLGMLNSRMKDYYDLWVLMREFEFDGELLRSAILATFNRRKTPIPSDVPLGLTDSFSTDVQKQIQWSAFLRRAHARKSVVAELKTVVKGIRAFLIPPMLAAGKSESFSRKWPKGGPWQV